MTGRSTANPVFGSSKLLSKLLSLPPLAALAAAASLAVGCSTSPGPAVAHGRVKPTYRADTGRLEKLAYDRNGDGREDGWAFMDGTRLIRAELDDDFDGRVERREFYAAGEQGQRSGGTVVIQGLGVLARVELVSKTGNVSRRETYDRGVLSTAEEDTNDDGRVDKWEQYENGALGSVALDTRGRGMPDRRVVYSPDGGAPRIETDADGSGQFRPSARAH